MTQQPSTAVERIEMPAQDKPVVTAPNAISNEQIRYIAGTDVVPKHLRNRPDAILATILKGRALGLDDIHSLSAIHFIEGKATLAAETMVVLVRREGHSIQFETEAGKSCKVTGKRKDTGDAGSVTWTIQMAKDAKLADKDVWKRYPDSMLWARAVSQLCRMLFADVLMGVSYTKEEAQEVAERGAITQAVDGLPGVGEQQVRTEPLSAPSEAQLNRIAALEERSREHFGSDSAYRMVLRGVHGVEMATELDADAATQYESQLEMALPPEESGEVVDRRVEGDADDTVGGTGSPVRSDASPAQDSAEGPSGTDSGADGKGPDTEPADATQDAPLGVVASPSADAPSGAEDEPGQAALPDTSAPEADELPGEPLLEEDEVVEGEIVAEEDEGAIPIERLVELAAETPVPLGTYRDKPLGEMHDGWIEWALENTARLPGSFVEALEIFTRERKPEIWKAVRGDA